MKYFLTQDPFGCTVIINETADRQYISFTETPDSSDYQAYQQWLAEGNTPEPWNPEEQ